MADCFIIMPLSTRDDLIPVYAGDNEHFKHVLECLFIPAIEKAGFKPIPPIAKGSDIIHVEIVQNLERADLVLCDMSSLNANVFFELGIRTAVGKPICVVKDDATPKVPFDMTVVNYLEYACSLAPWALSQQIEKLADHIKTSAQRSNGENLLWKYFSLSNRATLQLPKKDETEDRLALLSSQIEGLSKKIDVKKSSPTLNRPWQTTWEGLQEAVFTNEEIKSKQQSLLERLAKFAAGKGFHIVSFNIGDSPRAMVISVEGKPDNESLHEMLNIGLEHGFKLAIKSFGPP